MINNKILSASAGTGKTYRLAIEYISILIKNIYNPDFHFERILAITFTRKAAAEIRNKIFSMLNEILIDKNEKLINYLSEYCGIKIDDSILERLSKLNIKIKTQKDKVRISTIDSLVNHVFKSTIAPIMKLTHYTIEEKTNNQIYEEIFKELVKDENIDILIKLNEINTHKNIESLITVFNELIEKRWVLHLIDDRALGLYNDAEKDTTQRKLNFWFLDYFNFIYNFIMEVNKNNEFSSYFNNIFFEVLEINRNELNENNYFNHVDNFLKSGIYKLNKKIISEISDGNDIKLHNGTKIRKAKLKNFDELNKTYLKFIFSEYIEKEYNEILKLWKTILKKYDILKQQSAELTYSDITWFTYKYLYDPEYSMIDSKNLIVENQFYEFLSVRNQYLLIDEFQDTSLMQFLILAPLMNELSAGMSVFDETGVFIVGDEKQAIYGWRDGVRELLNYMQTFLGTKQNSMSINFRSSPIIINFINDLFQNIENNKGRYIEEWLYPEEMHCAQNEINGNVHNEIFEAEDENEAFTYFVEKIIKPFIQNDIHDTAVIARTNKELENIASLLQKNNIPFIRESSLSIFEHEVSNLILNLMSYMNNRDYDSLLRFLRSNLLLINGTELKNISLWISKNNTSNKPLPINLNKHLETIEEIYRKYHLDYSSELQLYKNPLILAKWIIDAFGITKFYQNEADLKNLHLFMSIISDFINNPENFTSDLDGFLRYVKEQKKKTDKKQLSTYEKNSINLLTIHKSKGLGFNTVFLYNDINSKNNRNDSLEIDYLIDNTSFNKFNNVYLGLNYKSILKKLFVNEYAEIEKRKYMEEINNTYVALTRAKTNLSVFWFIKSGKSIEANNIKSKLLQRIIELLEQNPNRYSRKMDNGKWIMDNVGDGLIRPEPVAAELTSVPSNHKTQPVAAEFTSVPSDISAIGRQFAHKCDLSSYIDIENKTLELTENPFQSFDATENNHFMIKNKKRLYGSATHLYLSFIKYNTPIEHKIAYLQTKRLYSNILSKDDIDEMVIKAKKFITGNPSIFSKNWDKVFNEFSVLSKDKKLSVIDRLMINTKEKKILIIDYKTGRITDPNQIEKYKFLLQQFPIVMNENYKIDTMFFDV